MFSFNILILIMSPQEQAREDLESKIKRNCEDGLVVARIKNKGRGVRATKHFACREFVVEYKGDLMKLPKAKELEREYER